jgi:hypothetical protein
MFTLFLDAAGQVVLAALLLGAGLPALFALGVRSFTLAGAAGSAGADGAITTPSRIPAPMLRAIGTLCYVLVVTAVAIGLSVIIATGFGQEVSFEHIVPTFVPKG